MKTTLIPPLSQSGWQHPFVKSFTQTSALFRPCWEISLLPLFWILCALCSPVQSPSKVSLQPSYLHQGRCFCVKSFECSSSTAPGFLFLVVLTEHCDIQPALLIYIYICLYMLLFSLRRDILLQLKLASIIHISLFCYRRLYCTGREVLLAFACLNMCIHFVGCRRRKQDRSSPLTLMRIWSRYAPVRQYRLRQNDNYSLLLFVTF